VLLCPPKVPKTEAHDNDAPASPFLQIDVNWCDVYLDRRSKIHRHDGIYSRRAFMYLKVNNTQQVRTDNIRSWELEARNVKEAWMAQWCGICKERIDSRTAESLEKIAAIDPQKYIAYVCRGVA
jgi:hypothetical protein